MSHGDLGNLLTIVSFWRSAVEQGVNADSVPDILYPRESTEDTIVEIGKKPPSNWRAGTMGKCCGISATP